MSQSSFFVVVVLEPTLAALCANSSCDNCRNSTEGTAECYCLSGYVLSANNETCEGKNQCLSFN